MIHMKASHYYRENDGMMDTRQKERKRNDVAQR